MGVNGIYLDLKLSQNGGSLGKASGFKAEKMLHFFNDFSGYPILGKLQMAISIKNGMNQYEPVYLDPLSVLWT